MKKILIWFGAVVLILLLSAGTFFGLYIYPFMKVMKATKTIAYDKDLTLIIGGGGNTGILKSDSIVLVIDTKMDEAAEKLFDTVKQIAGNRPVLVINSHIHSDHVKGNSLFKGYSILAGGNYSKEKWLEEAGEKTMPTQWLKDRMDFKVGDEWVTILNLGKNIHTISDVVVYLHNRKMLFAGDVILNKQVPAIFKKHGASVNGYLNAFDFLTKEFDIQTVVPGHGDIGGVEVINNFRQYFIDMKTAANDPSKESEYKEKYKDWRQIPFLMSPSATIGFIKEEGEQK